MMTRKDYVKTADILFSIKLSVAPEVHQFLIDEFAIMFKKDNERFDTKRFEEACK